MADELIVDNQVAEPSVEDYVKEQMALHLGGGSQQQTPQQQAAELAGVQPPVIETKEPEVVVTPDVSTDVFAPFKERFGYESPEAALAEIEELRKLKEAPATIEYEFENEQSKKLFEAFKAGKENEVYDYLRQKAELERASTLEVTKDSAADIIKLGMQLKYKDLTPQEIEYKFSKQFSLPKEPKMDADEDEAEFRERHNEWKETVADIEMNKIIEAKLIKPEIEASKSKLVLPEIEANVDEEYVNWKNSAAENQKRAQENTEAYRQFKADAFETKIGFNDEANKINFEFQYKPSPEVFAKAQELVMDGSKYVAEFTNSDGSPNRQKFFSVILKGLDYDNAITEAMKQSKNATLKAGLPDNTAGGLNRQNPIIGEPSELHEMMRMAGVIK